MQSLKGWLTRRTSTGVESAPEFPYVQPQLGLIVTFLYESAADDRAHEVIVVIEDDAGAEVARIAAANVAPPTPGFEERETPMVINLLGNVTGVTFPGAGRYWVVLSLDGNEIDRMVLEVRSGVSTPG
jgi:hypothetical protein